MKHFFWGLGTLFFGWFFVFTGSYLMVQGNLEMRFLCAIALAILFVGGVIAILLIFYKLFIMGIFFNLTSCSYLSRL